MIRRPFAGFFSASGALRLRVWREPPPARADLGAWRVDWRARGTAGGHIARFTSRRAASAFARTLRLLLRGRRP